MNRTKIEWVRNSDGSQGYTINPVKGYCPMACPYCYARRMYDRFKWDKAIRYIPPRFTIADLQTIKKPSRIFWGSTFELFHGCVPNIWLQDTFKIVEQFPQHTHIFLTKQPQNLKKGSFSKNCWVGVSVDGTNNAPLGRMLYTGFDKIQATVKFISFEPLLASPKLDKRDLARDFANIQLIIIGAETGNRQWGHFLKPPLSQVQGWAREIITVADEAGIPVFTKDNLKLPANEMRRDWPKP